MVAPHFHGLYSFLQVCCEGPWFTSIQENGCDKGVLQSHIKIKRNTPGVPNWFQPCQCYCRQCYPEEYIRLGTLVSNNWAHILEACDCLKLMSIYFDLFVDVTRERINRVLELREILLSFQTGFNIVNAAVVCAVQEIILGLEPSSVITEPRYSKLVTVSSFCPFTLISVLTPLVLFFINLVFSHWSPCRRLWRLCRDAQLNFCQFFLVC